MAVTVAELLRLSLFKTARLVSGRDGLDRNIEQISVFDCPFTPEDANIISKGDAFISGLHQFRDDPHTLVEFVRFLYLTETSCLLITDENMNLFTEDVIESLSSIPYPIISFPKQYSYVKIMETVRSQIFQYNRGGSSEWALHTILNQNVSGFDLREMIYQLNPSFESNIAVLSFFPKSAPLPAAASLDGLLKKQELFVFYQRHCMILVSDSDKGLLASRIKYLKSMLPSYVSDIFCGISSIYPLYDIKLAILNASFLLTKSSMTGNTFCTAEAFDSLDLLIAFRYDQSVQDYYKRLYNLIQTFDSDGNLELIKTIQTFILCKGSYKETAKSLSQHENTIRYRLNRLRGLLGMEDDVILFHETMSVFVKLHMLFSKTI